MNGYVNTEIQIYICMFTSIFRPLASQVQERRCWYAAMDRTMQKAEKEGPEESGLGLRPKCFLGLLLN